MIFDSCSLTWPTCDVDMTSVSHVHQRINFQTDMKKARLQHNLDSRRTHFLLIESHQSKHQSSDLSFRRSNRPRLGPLPKNSVFQHWFFRMDQKSSRPKPMPYQKLRFFPDLKCHRKSNQPKPGCELFGSRMVFQ